MTALTFDRFYELYGEEVRLDSLEEWQALDRGSKHLWTAVDGEGYSVTYLNGFHYVNRLYYVMMDNPWNEGDDIYVSDFPDDKEYIEGETCGFCANDLTVFACPSCTKSEDVCTNCCGCEVN